MVFLQDKYLAIQSRSQLENQVLHNKPQALRNKPQALIMAFSLPLNRGIFVGVNDPYMNDFLLDENGDLLIEDGDLVIGDATTQNQQLILVAHKGEFKESPEIGVGISDALSSENLQELTNTIRRNFEYDGMTVNEIEIKPNGVLNVDAYYK